MLLHFDPLRGWIAGSRRVIGNGRAGYGSAALALLMFAACGQPDRQLQVVDSAASPAGRTDPAIGKPGVATSATPIDYVPPMDSAMPAGPMGASIRRGLALLTHTTDSLPAFAPGNIQCVSCHIEGGRRRNAASLAGVHARFPKYMDRSGAVIPIEDRVNYCFTRSLAGNRLPSDSREMQDIVAYLAFISTGVPIGARVAGEGMPKMPALTGDGTRGAQLFAATCTVCHGVDGQGNPPAFPALWGPGSYSIGASMARQERAASFIRHFMPQDNRGSLTDQQAFDLAAYINAQPRPDSPGKSDDWPLGGAASDVPYDTKGHKAFHPPARLLPRANARGAIVPPPPSVRRTGEGVR